MTPLHNFPVCRWCRESR